MPGAMQGFFALFILFFIAIVATNVYKFSQTKQMAIRKGATEQEATVVALSGDLGTAAAYVRPPAAPEARTTEERIREVRDLQDKGLITAEQAEQRVAEILRSV